MGLTGIPTLDRLIEPVRRDWITEFYGSEAAVKAVIHHSITELAKKGKVAIVHVQDFGGLNPYTISRLARLKRVNEDNIVIARAFRLRDVPQLILKAVEIGAESIVVFDPYLYGPRSWIGYSLLTRVTGAIREAAKASRVVVANRTSKFGLHLLPEGGNFHHHSIHVIVRLDRKRNGVLATLIKHPGKKVPLRVLVSCSEMVSWLWGGPRPLLEYL